MHQRLALCVLLGALGLRDARAGVDLTLGGAGGGGFYTSTNQWGTALGFDGAGSPLVSVEVDLGDGPVRPMFGLTSAPTFLYSAGYDAYTAPLVVADLGVVFGSDRSRFSTSVHGGLLSVGASARWSHTPWALGAKARTGFEVRATWLARAAVLGGAGWVVRL